LLFPSALMGVLFPAFAESFARDRVRTAQLFDKGVRAVVLVIFPVSLILVTLASEILHLWVGAEFARAGSVVLQWLAVGALINSVGFVGFAVLQGVGRPDLTGKLNLVELPLYVAAIWVLAKTMGLPGVAIAWTVRVFIDTAALWVMARRSLAVDRKLLHTPAVTWLSMGLALLVGAMLPGTMARIAYVFAAAAVYLPVAWFGLITPSERQAVRRLMRRSMPTIDDPSRQAA
jgi:O-antigen/teichoic acid export membrane protein